MSKATEPGRGRARIPAQGGLSGEVQALGLRAPAPRRALVSELSSTPPCLSVAQGTGDFCSAPDTFILNITEGQIRTGNEPLGPRLSEPLQILRPGPRPAGPFSPVITCPHTLGPAGPPGHLLEAPSLGSVGTGLAPGGGEGLVACELPPDADAFALQM